MTHAQIEGKYYWGATPVAYYTPGGAIHFEQQDWLGTERMRTAYNGGVEGSFTSLPWGDSASVTGADTDANHFATLDHDAETDIQVHGARTMAAMRMHGIANLLTLNAKDFRRFSGITVLSPDEVLASFS